MRKFLARWALWTVGIAAGVPLLVAALVFYPIVFNRYLFPLGWVYGSIEKGEAYADVRPRFVAYYEVRKLTSDDVQFGEREPTTSRGRSLFLYDLTGFDDVQLEVTFDDRDRVAEVSFVGD